MWTIERDNGYFDAEAQMWVEDWNETHRGEWDNYADAKRRIQSPIRERIVYHEKD